MAKDWERFPPNNILLTLAGAGLLWMGWTRFNGGAPYAANVDASVAIINTHVCTAASLLVWLSLDMLFFTKPSVIGAIQGMITGLVCIIPAVVQDWAAIVMGILLGSIPWFTMMVLHKKIKLHKKVDDTLAVLHTHAVAGSLSGILTGIFADPSLNHLFFGDDPRYIVLWLTWSTKLVKGFFLFTWSVWVRDLFGLAFGFWDSRQRGFFREFFFFWVIGCASFSRVGSPSSPDSITAKKALHGSHL